MNIKTIIKKGLTGKEIGKLFLEDYTDYNFKLGKTAKKYRNKETSLKQSLNIKGLLSESEKEMLYNSLKQNEDIKNYNNYMAILRYLSDVSIKMAYFQVMVYSDCLKLSYLLVTEKRRKSDEKKYKTKKTKGIDIPGIIKQIEENYFYYLIMKTSILLIEEVTGNKNIFNSVDHDPDQIDKAEKLLNMELRRFYENSEPSKKRKHPIQIKLLTREFKDINGKKIIYKGIEIPKKTLDIVKEKIKDLSFFKNNEYKLHHILIKGLENE